MAPSGEKVRGLLLGWHLNNSNCTNMDGSEGNARIRCLSVHFYHCKDGFGCKTGLTTGDGGIPFCAFSRKTYDHQCELLHIRPIHSRWWDVLLVVKPETVWQLFGNNVILEYSKVGSWWSWGYYIMITDWFIWLKGISLTLLPPRCLITVSLSEHQLTSFQPHSNVEARSCACRDAT